jgi:uncharacterized protein YceH (UPF0502 family)
LQGLIDRDGGALVARLLRTPGRLDSEYMHLFYGAIESAPAELAKTAVDAPVGRRIASGNSKRASVRRTGTDTTQTAVEE